MNPSLHPGEALPPTTAKPAAASLGLSRQLRLLALCAGVLVLCFAMPLVSLARLALHSDLYSHILLVPFVSFYLAWLRKPDLLALATPSAPGQDPAEEQPATQGEDRIVGADLAQSSTRNRKSRIPPPLASLCLVTGLLLLAGYFFALRSGLKLAPVDSLAWTTLSFVLFFLAASSFCLGKRTLRSLAFPLAFLVFLVPFPVVVKDAIESFLQHRSADAAELLFGLAGTPLLRHGVDFQLPGFSLQVAPECSGIRSSFVLFITSLVAGQLFLRSPWKRALFALAVIPLGIFRNAFRIVVIGELCVHVDPGFIDSPIHHRGGPVFFAISMIPFLLLLYYLRKTDVRKHRSRDATARV